jgi:hypothetical protein
METRTTPNYRRLLSFAALVHVVIIAVLFTTVAGKAATPRGSGAPLQRLVFTRQPASAQVGESISSSAYNPTGNPVQVTVVDENNQVVTTFIGTITLSLKSNPGNGVLSGILERNVSEGRAEFPDISLNQSGFGYRLHAVACPFCGSFLRGGEPVNPADSRKFDIVDVVKECDAGPCESGVVTDGDTSAHMETSAGDPNDMLFFSVSPGQLNCALYRETSSLVTFEVTGPRTKTITVEVPRTGARTPSSYQVCYSSPNTFSDRNGQLVNKGLLPDCVPTTNDPAPCVVSRGFVEGQMVIVFSAPLGDPKGRV